MPPREERRDGRRSFLGEITEAIADAMAQLGVVDDGLGDAGSNADAQSPPPPPPKAQKKRAGRVSFGSRADEESVEETMKRAAAEALAMDAADAVVDSKSSRETFVLPAELDDVVRFETSMEMSLDRGGAVGFGDLSVDLQDVSDEEEEEEEEGDEDEDADDDDGRDNGGSGHCSMPQNRTRLPPNYFTGD